MRALKPEDQDARAIIFTQYDRVQHQIVKVLKAIGLGGLRVQQADGADEAPPHHQGVPGRPEEGRTAEAVCRYLRHRRRRRHAHRRQPRLPHGAGEDPATELQAAGRIHRLGQTKEVLIKRFAFRNTIEHAIVDLHEEIKAKRVAGGEGNTDPVVQQTFKKHNLHKEVHTSDGTRRSPQVRAAWRVQQASRDLRDVDVVGTRRLSLPLLPAAVRHHVEEPRHEGGVAGPLAARRAPAVHARARPPETRCGRWSVSDCAARDEKFYVTWEARSRSPRRPAATAPPRRPRAPSARTSRSPTATPPPSTTLAPSAAQPARNGTRMHSMLNSAPAAIVVAVVAGCTGDQRRATQSRSRRHSRSAGASASSSAQQRTAPARRGRRRAQPAVVATWQRHERRGERDGLVVVRHELAGALAQRVELVQPRGAPVEAGARHAGARAAPPATARQPPYGKLREAARRRRAHTPNIPRSSAAARRPRPTAYRTGRRRCLYGHDWSVRAPRPSTRPGRSSTTSNSIFSPGETSTAKSSARGVPNGGRKAAKEVVAERFASMISTSEIGRL